jgi:NAD(P)-dependent dehydrogenase (short-subunit alcohol dehydrogenase family)
MKSIIITGATSGIGLSLTKSMAKKDFKIIMACRDTIKAEKIKWDIIEATGNKEISVFYLDLEKKQTMKTFIERVREHCGNIDILVNNAGVFQDEFSEVEGIEKTMYINFYATRMLTEGLLPLMCVEGKIINIVSKAGLYGDFTQKLINSKKKLKGFKAYAASKLALILYTKELGEKLNEDRSIKVYAIHPGSVATNIWRGNSLLMKIIEPIMKLISKKPEQAIDTIEYLIDNNLESNFYGDRKVIPLSKKTRSPETYRDYKNLFEE